MRKIRIVIVDSGVRLDHPAVQDHHPVVVRYSGLREGEGDCGHGTAIYNIVKKTESFADIINFQITNKDGEICEETLLSCLNTIKEEYDADIINLSLGLSLCDDLTQLRQTCDELSKKGVVIISAFDNMGAISYPAAFSNVIGVTSVDLCRKVSDFIVFSDDVINIGANGNLQRLAWNAPDYIFFHGNSFACAHVTVQAAQFMSEGAATFSEIMSRFREISLQIAFNDQQHTKKTRPFEIKRASIFPFNKEMHSVVRFYDLLPFEISGVYDIRESSRVGSTTDHIMKADVKSFPIKNVDKMEWDSFDTVILGNIPAQNAHLLSKAREKIVEKAILLGKNIFSFDDLKKNCHYEKLYCPTVDHSDVPAERLGKLYRISKPVIGIYGTSSNQGKFTLQLELRKKFLESGYVVGQIGTEPSAQLFGMDYTYPMGFNSGVYIDGHDAVAYLNECIHSLCIKNCEVIITGSQASVLPYDICNKSMFPLKQFNFLMGTQPDCMVLCINPYDDIDYIQRTIFFLESSVAGKVIGLCIYPMNYKSDWTGMYHQKELLSETEIEFFKTMFSQEFNIPSYQLGSAADIASLYEDVVAFFSH